MMPLSKATKILLMGASGGDEKIEEGVLVWRSPRLIRQLAREGVIWMTKVSNAVSRQHLHGVNVVELHYAAIDFWDI